MVYYPDLGGNNRVGVNLTGGLTPQQLQFANASGFSMVGGVPGIYSSKFRAARLANVANGTTDFYTCPAGKRASLMVGILFNSTAGAISWRLNAKINGTYYPFTALSSSGAGTSLGTTTSFTLEAGESFAIETTAVGTTFWVRIAEYDNNSPYRTVRVPGIAAGDNLLVTCKTGKIMVNHPALFAGAISGGGVASIYTKVGVTINAYSTTSGSLVADATSQTTASVAAAANAVAAISVSPILAAGESLILNSSGADAAGMLVANYSEWDA
jgi:hypothetical protein